MLGPLGDKWASDPQRNPAANNAEKPPNPCLKSTNLHPANNHRSIPHPLNLEMPKPAPTTRFFCLLLLACVLCSCGETKSTSAENTVAESTAKQPTTATNKVLLVEDVDWTQLNPARGDKSPLAGTLWGDRNGEVPTGFLARFPKGFSSPPHIHNVSYRAVVIEGLIHNDDPMAAPMWMAPGSFWTQPAGEAHITSADGDANMCLVEIDRGPYLVQPTEEAFDNGERPINVDVSNVIWLDAPNTNNGAQISYLWGNPKSSQDYGVFMKLPAGFAGDVLTSGTTFRGVVISGAASYTIPGEGTQHTLAPGSYFTSTGDAVHSIGTKSACVVYVRTNGRIEFAAAH